MFLQFLLLLLFVDNKLFIEKLIHFNSYCKYDFSNSMFCLHRSPKNIACNQRSIFLTNIFPNIHFRQILQDFKYTHFYLLSYAVCLIYPGVLNDLWIICNSVSLVEFMVSFFSNFTQNWFFQWQFILWQLFNPTWNLNPFLVGASIQSGSSLFARMEVSPRLLLTDIELEPFQNSTSKVSLMKKNSCSSQCYHLQDHTYIDFGFI